MPNEESVPEIARGDLYKDLGKEIVARFQVQNQILFGFVAVSTTLISASLTNPDFSFVDVGVGFLALFSSALGAHHDIMIANLGYYQRILLEKTNPELSHVWQNFRTGKLRQGQRLSYWTQLFLYLVLGIGSLSTISVPRANLLGLKWVFFWVSAACYALSLACLIYGWKKREEIDLRS